MLYASPRQNSILAISKLLQTVRYWSARYSGERWTIHTVTHVVTGAIVTGEERQGVVGIEILRILVYELCHTFSSSAMSSIRNMVKTLPLTASHKVATVFGHSYSEMVNPFKVRCEN